MAPNSVRSVDVAGKATEVASATKNAATISELISTIPQTWRAALADYLNKVHRAAQKLCNVQNTIATYDRHVAESSFPASIRNSVKELKIQFSKEYLGTAEGSLYEGLAKAEVYNARKALLTFALQRKREELATLQDQVKYDGPLWRKTILDVATRVATTFSGKVEGDSNKTVEPNWSDSVPATLREDCKALWTSGQIYHYRAVGLARSAADRSLVEKTRKLSIKTDTDIQMKDADSERTTRDLIKEEMQSNNRLLKQELAKMIGTLKKPAPRKSGKKSGQNKNPTGVRKGPPKNGKKGRK